MSQPQTTTQPRKVDVSWPQVVASALAAVSSAVLLSTVGVAGTLIGAAVGSVIATVGTALYRYSLEASRERVAAAQNAALTRVARARAQAHVARGAGLDDTYAQRRLAQAEDELDHAEHDLDEAEVEAETERPSWREMLWALPWKRIGLVAAAVFVVAMLVILAFELITGRAVSTYTGGTSGSDRTTFSGLTGGGGSSSKQQTPSQQQTGTGGQSTAPSAQASQQSTPSEGSTPSQDSTPSEAPSVPPETPTQEPSSVPTTGAPGPVTSSP